MIITILSILLVLLVILVLLILLALLIMKLSSSLYVFYFDKAFLLLGLYLKNSTICFKDVFAFYNLHFKY
jgi:hypothetical protein